MWKDWTVSLVFFKGILEFLPWLMESSTLKDSVTG